MLDKDARFRDSSDWEDFGRKFIDLLKENSLGALKMQF